MNRILLAYCQDNADVAQSIDRKLSRVGIPFEHVTEHDGEGPGHLASYLTAAGEPVVLIVTDNLLKNAACMTGMLSALQTLTQGGRLAAVVADGRRSHDGGQTFERVETHFDRMSYALQYMNYWQNAWLDLSDRHYHPVEGAETNAQEGQLANVRNIANEMGEIISLLRNTGFYSLEQFENQHFAAFFQKFGLQQWHEQYRRVAEFDDDTPPLPVGAPPRPLAEIPHVTGILAPAPAEEEHAAIPETPQAAAPVDTAHPEFEESDAPLEVAAFDDPTTTDEPAAPDLNLSEDAQMLSADEAVGDLPATDEPAAPEQPLPDDEAAGDTTADQEDDLGQHIRDAWFWLEHGQHARGMELFRAFLEIYPEDALLKSEYARAVEQFGADPEPAMPTFQPETEQLSDETRANEAKSYDLMGSMALEKGDHLFAKYCWDRTAEMDPKYPGLYRKLGLMTSEHLPDYRETAAQYLKYALDENPRDGEVLAALARLSYLAGDADAASAYYEKAIAYEPGLRSAENDRQYLPDSPAASSDEPPAASVAAEDEAQFASAAAGQPETQRKDVLTVLITGATSGIGRATAELFARNGHRLILTGRRVELLVGLKNALETNHDSDILALPFDVQNFDAVSSALENLPETWQEIDVLVNNAGGAKGLEPIHEGRLDQWDFMIDTNIKGLLYVTKIVAQGMVRRRRGQIINLSSAAGKEVYPKGNVYCAVKHAVEALTKSMRLDLHAHNIRVGQVSPGHVEDTEFALVRFEGDVDRAKIYQDFQPLKAADVADAIYYMATRPPHVNIQDIHLYGTQQASTTVLDRSGR
jgi:NADP-dependent 3-hydroxy acid dehydrogenase YdfG/Tfp pilus assembly protein PilF